MLYFSNMASQQRKSSGSIKGEKEQTRPQLQRKLSQQEIGEVVDRLTAKPNKGVVESNRTGADKKMGIMNSYAWQGWN